MSSKSKPLAIVLGANGFLGQNLCYWLLKNGYSVLAAGRKDFFAGKELFDNTHLRYMSVNLELADQANEIPIAKADVIYMMAGQTGTSTGFSQYQYYVSANELALLNLLSAYQRQNAKGRIVFPSSRLVYKGQKGKMLNENDLKDALTVYAVNKIACENYLHVWGNAFGIPYTIFRICVPYGQLIPGNYSYGTLGFMLNQAKCNKAITLYGDGSTSRTFSHIEDICEVLGRAGIDASVNQKTLNIGGADHLSLLQLAEMIANKYYAKVEFIEWPELDKAIESGDTMFDDTLLQNLFPYTYKGKLSAYIETL